tara:strand:- start:12683 stop:13114 length:432 start_codon:yes stop_codon:yes gene_type:complete
LSTSYSPSLVLTWTDHRPRPVWCAVCLLLLVALAEIAWRGYGLWALLGLLLWIPLAWFGWPAPPGAQELLLAPHGSQLWQEDGAEPVAIELLSGTVLLPRVVVLHWRPVAGRGRRFLWLWVHDLGEDNFRALRRWWLVFGRKA